MPRNINKQSGSLHPGGEDLDLDYDAEEFDEGGSDDPHRAGNNNGQLTRNSSIERLNNAGGRNTLMTDM